MRPAFLAVLTACLCNEAVANFFPPAPSGTTTVQVEGLAGVKLSYKETFFCETKAKAYAGYVHMPISYLHDIETEDPYQISMFFWYFEARQNPQNASTSIYLAGGPGESSMYGVAQDGGPCVVLPDSNSTANNPFAFNTHVNMLYVDQPVGSGFSYDKLVNSTLNLLYTGSESVKNTGIVPMSAYGEHVPESNATFLYGTLPSQNPLHTANNSAIAARTLWKFAQAWFTGFPHCNTSNQGISIWGNSYGGYWTTSSGAYFQHQNQKIHNGESKGKILHLEGVGMTNGCLDMLYEGGLYPEMAYNNTYDLQVIPEKAYQKAKNDFRKPGGCRDLIEKCRQLGDLSDPHQLSNNATVNKACLDAEAYCTKNVLGPYSIYSNRSAFDMAFENPNPFPSSYIIGFFNQRWVQQDLGVPVNFTSDSELINNIFLYKTGDAVRTAGMKHVEYLLAAGVKVTFVYGDRDYRCPWLGVENLSLKANWTGANAFRKAGYEAVQTNSSYNGGVVRQHGNLSFVRVFESGHDVAAYQPETAFDIFTRSILNKDIATGKHSITSGYSTTGPLSSLGIKNKLPASLKPSCNLWNIPSTCTLDQFEALEKGTAKIVNTTIVNPSGGGGPSVVGSF